MTDSKNTSQGSDFARFLALIEQEERVEARMRMCEEYLNAGTLTRRQTGVVHGLLGGGYFELAYDRMRAAYASGTPSQADVAQSGQDFRRSVQHYTTAIGMNPGNFVDHWNRGFSYECMGDLDHALSDYTETVKLKPDFGKAYLYRARIFQQRGDTVKAIADILEAPRVDPKEPAVIEAMSRLGPVK
jgi:tetratricopeptide (TPR) repeat protein